MEWWLLQRRGLLLLNVYMSYTCIPRIIMWQVGIKLEVFMSVCAGGSVSAVHSGLHWSNCVLGLG